MKYLKLTSWLMVWKYETSRQQILPLADYFINFSQKLQANQIASVLWKLALVYSYLFQGLAMTCVHGCIVVLLLRREIIFLFRSPVSARDAKWKLKLKEWSWHTDAIWFLFQGLTMTGVRGCIVVLLLRRENIFLFRSPVIARDAEWKLKLKEWSWHTDAIWFDGNYWRRAWLPNIFHINWDTFDRNISNPVFY